MVKSFAGAVLGLVALGVVAIIALQNALAPILHLGAH